MPHCAPVSCAYPISPICVKMALFRLWQSFPGLVVFFASKVDVLDFVVPGPQKLPKDWETPQDQTCLTKEIGLNLAKNVNARRANGTIVMGPHHPHPSISKILLFCQLFWKMPENACKPTCSKASLKDLGEDADNGVCAHFLGARGSDGVMCGHWS